MPSQLAEKRVPSLERRYAPSRGRSYWIFPDGRIGVDPAKQGVVPYTLVTEPNTVTVPGATDMTASLLAGGLAVQPVPMPVDNKGPVECIYITSTGRKKSDGTPVDDYTVSVFDPDGRYVLSNRDIHVKTMAGGFGSALGAGQGSALSSAGGRPMILPESFFLEPTRNGKALFIGFRNLTTDDIEVRFAFHGVRFYHLKPYKEALREKRELFGADRICTPFFYTTDRDILLAADANDEYQIRITDDADAEIFKLAHERTNPYLVRFKEQAGQRFLDNSGLGLLGVQNGIHSDLVFGDAEFPFILYESYYLEQNFKIKMQVVNTLVSAENRIFPTLISRRIAHVPEGW
jgi:hypothetical protein